MFNCRASHTLDINKMVLFFSVINVSCVPLWRDYYCCTSAADLWPLKQWSHGDKVSQKFTGWPWTSDPPQGWTAGVHLSDLFMWSWRCMGWTFFVSLSSRHPEFSGGLKNLWYCNIPEFSKDLSLDHSAILRMEMSCSLYMSGYNKITTLLVSWCSIFLTHKE